MWNIFALKIHILAIEALKEMFFVAKGIKANHNRLPGMRLMLLLVLR